MYKGSRLHDLCKMERGLAARLSQAMFGKNKGIDRYYHDGINLTIDNLEKIAMYTGRPVDYFLEYDHKPSESVSHSNVYGNNNIVNSPMANESWQQKIEFLQKEIKLKDEIIASERSNNSSQAELIKNLKERINDLITLMQSGSSAKSQT